MKTKLDRITFNPKVMGGKPCIRGMRVTAGMILGQLAAGRTPEEILEDYRTSKGKMSHRLSNTRHCEFRRHKRQLAAKPVNDYIFFNP